MGNALSSPSPTTAGATIRTAQMPSPRRAGFTERSSFSKASMRFTMGFNTSSRGFSPFQAVGSPSISS